MACVTALLALWIGYSLGYNQGSRDEETAWLSTHVRPDKADGDLVCYRNPHIARLHENLGIAPINRPDPRTYKKYEPVLR